MSARPDGFVLRTWKHLRDMFGILLVARKTREGMGEKVTWFQLLY